MTRSWFEKYLLGIPLPIAALEGDDKGSVLPGIDKIAEAIQEISQSNNQSQKDKLKQ